MTSIILYSIHTSQVYYVLYTHHLYTIYYTNYAFVYNIVLGRNTCATYTRLRNYIVCIDTMYHYNIAMITTRLNHSISPSGGTPSPRLSW